MKIKYEFVNETIEIEVDEEYGKLIKRMNLTMESDERTLRNHENLMDTQNDYSTWVITGSTENRDKRSKEIENAFDELSDKQSELINFLYGPEPITAKEYAKNESVSPAAISYRKRVIRKKLKKLFKKT